MKTLEAKGIRSAYVTGEPGNEQVKDGVRAGHCQLVFFTPELLLDSPQWRNVLCSELYKNRLKAFVLDEVHCIKKWRVQYNYIIILVK